MNFYEIAYLVSIKAEGEKLKEIQKKVLDLIKKHEGEIEEESTPLKRSLAYPIKKENEAFLISVTFWMAPSKMKDFKKDVDEIKEIMRYLIVKREAKKEKVAEKKKLVKKPEKVELEKLEEKLEEILGTEL